MYRAAVVFESETRVLLCAQSDEREWIKDVYKSFYIRKNCRKRKEDGRMELVKRDRCTVGKEIANRLEKGLVSQKDILYN